MQQGSDSFRLVIRRGPQPNQTFDLTKDVMTIGRDITNDFVINDPEVSRHHIRFTRGAGGFTIEDIGSTNGTYVNGQRLVGAKPLNNGDMIGLGETVTLGYEALRDMAAGGAAPTAQNPVYGGAAYVTPGQPAPQNPYQPPAQQPYAQPAQNAAPYGAPPAAAPYGQQNAPYSYSPPPAYNPAGAQAVPGEYEPMEAEERNPMRWIMIGCIGLLVFCCCSSVAILWVIDSACLWDSLPLIPDILSALGYFVAC